VFGGRDRTANGTGGARVGEVHGALLNKKFGKLVVRRVAASDAVKASFTWETAAGGGGAQVLKVEASSVGLWGNDVSFKIEAAGDANANHFKLTVRYQGKEIAYDNLDITGTNDNLALVTVGADDANWVVLTKLAAGRPSNTVASADGADANAYVALGQTAVTNYTGVAGADGALAVGDYNAAVNDLAVYPGISVVFVPEAVPTVATFHSNLVTLAALVSDRIFLTWAHAHGQAIATETTQVTTQITTRNDRIWWCYNGPVTIDPDTDAEVQQAPHVWLASILSQVPASVHPGSAATVALLAGIKRLTVASLTRLDLIALRSAGICALERTDEGFQFRSIVTTDLTSGKTEGTRRRIADYLQLGSAKRLRHWVKDRNTAIVRGTMAGELTAFSRAEQNPETGTIEDFQIDQITVNTTAQRSQGIEKLLWRVKPIDFILALVFETEIGNGVVIVKQVA
jgi:hypothetical protein